MKNIVLKSKAYLLLIMLTPVFARAQHDIQFGVANIPDTIVLLQGQTFLPGIVVHVTGAGGNVNWTFGGLSHIDPPGSSDPGWTSTPGTSGAQKTCHNIAVTLPALDVPVPTGPLDPAVTVQQTGAVVPLEGEIHFTLIATNSADVPTSRQYVIRVRKPVELMMVLDGSGSMAWGYDGNTAPSTGQRRWDGLKTGVGAIAAQLGFMTTSLISQDQLGVRMFSTDVIAPALPSPFNGMALLPLQANIPNLTSAVPADQPGGWTALGDGIIAGRNMFALGTTTKKAMIVFSDGEQTVGHSEGPPIKVTGTGAYMETETTPAQSLSRSGDIKIYTIGLGTTGSFPATMQQIAFLSGGSYLNATTGTTGFPTFFPTTLNNIFSGSSPQFVDIRNASFPVPTGDQSSVTEQSFSVNKGSGSVIITLFVSPDNRAVFTSLTKDGVELIQFARITTGSGFITIAVPYPVQGLPVTSLAGEWKVRAQAGIRPKNPLPYTITVVTDDHVVHPEYSLQTGTFKVGDAVHPTVTLRQEGRSIRNAAVQAIIVKPGDDLNDLLARSNVAFNTPTVDSASPDVSKLAVLMNDPDFVNKIKASEQVINLLYNAADSTYKGTFNGLNVTGVYQMLYRITANDSMVGKIQRFQQQSFYVRFPDININNSNIRDISEPRSSKSILTARFISSTGKLIGSGWGSTIGISAPGLSIEKVTDLGDGSYRIYLSGKLSGRGKLSLFTETFYDGDLANIGGGTAPHFSLSAHIGRTFPTGNFDKFYNPGWLGEVDAEYQFSKHFSAELVGGYYNFDSSYKIIGGTAYLKAHATLNSFHAYLGAGPGFYKPDNIKASLGISGKVGVQKSLNNKLWVDMNGAYFNVFTPNQSINFLTASLGLKYYF